MNGRQGFMGTFGTPPFKPVARQGEASHLAGREGFRWGWLVRLIGWEGAAKVAAMKPAQRKATILKLRQAASAAFKQAMIAQRAVQVEAQTPVSSDLVPAAGVPASGAQGASNGFGSADYLGNGYGDPVMAY